MREAAAAISCACMRSPFAWAMAICLVMLSPLAWQLSAGASVKKDQARIVQDPELVSVPVLYTRDDPWIVKEVRTTGYGRYYYEEATRDDGVKPRLEVDEKKTPIGPKTKDKKRSGLDEVIRTASRSALLSYAKADIGKRGPQMGLPSTLYCADAINAWLRKIGLPGTGSRMARSFVAHPKFEKIVKPQPGDIVVIRRGRSAVYGHVALYNGPCGKGGIRLLGGNQAGGRVTNQCVPAGLVVAYARPKTIPETVVARLLT